MTKSAIEIAIEALRKIKGDTIFSTEWRASQGIHRRVAGIAQTADAALAALTTEPVPPDRERALAKLDNHISASEYYSGFVNGITREELIEWASLLRQPAPAEVPPGIAGLIADIRTKGGLITCPDMLDFLNIVERRLAPPAVGDWRPIAEAPKDGTEVDLWIEMVGGAQFREPKCHYHCGEWLYWGGDPEIGWQRAEDQDKGRYASHWMTMPAPPIPEDDATKTRLRIGRVSSRSWL